MQTHEPLRAVTNLLAGWTWPTKESSVKVHIKTPFCGHDRKTSAGAHLTHPAIVWDVVSPRRARIHILTKQARLRRQRMH